jgi:hypothetical protein
MSINNFKKFISGESAPFPVLESTLCFKSCILLLLILTANYIQIIKSGLKNLLRSKRE